ncbi:hypothetical protein ACFOLC_04270 [Lysobacter cavernae]|uniref:Uncharacterized protein n=1 Tax=Lysobacter cavernae TaxID=1685901 RepID=A0ABV7RN20_9GAMM
MNAMRLNTRWVPLSLALLAASASAQQRPLPVPTNTVRPAVVTPLPQPQLGSQQNNPQHDPAAKLSRDIQAASRRVQADSIGSEIQRRDVQIESDRLRTDRLRAASRDPVESQRLRNDYEQRRADNERRRVELEHQRQQVAPPPDGNR